jgi:hypothetical protein
MDLVCAIVDVICQVGENEHSGKGIHGGGKFLEHFTDRFLRPKKIVDVFFSLLFIGFFEQVVVVEERESRAGCR